MSLTEKLRESLYKEIFMKLTVAIFLYFRLILEGHDLDKKDDVEFTPKELAKILSKFYRYYTFCKIKKAKYHKIY